MLRPRSEVREMAPGVAARARGRRDSDLASAARLIVGLGSVCAGQWSGVTIRMLTSPPISVRWLSLLRPDTLRVPDAFVTVSSIARNRIFTINDYRHSMWQKKTAIRHRIAGNCRKGTRPRASSQDRHFAPTRARDNLLLWGHRGGAAAFAIHRLPTPESAQAGRPRQWWPTRGMVVSQRFPGAPRRGLCVRCVHLGSESRVRMRIRLLRAVRRWRRRTVAHA